MRAVAGEEPDVAAAPAFSQDDVPTLELPAVVGPSEAAAGAPPAPDGGPVLPDAAPHAEPEPVRPLRMIVIGDRDGLTGPSPARPPLAPVPSAVPNARRGRLVFGDDAPARPDEFGGEGADTPALVIGPPVASPAAAAGAEPGSTPPRTIVIGDADDADGAVAIDPRIKERRTRVLRAAGLRRLRWVLAVLAVVALVVGFNVTLRSPLFQVRTVEITGTSFLDPVDLQFVQDELIGRPLASVDLAAMRRSIEELVWVRTVDVSRDWPRTVRVDIEERRPVAYYPGDDGLIHLVDVDGLVLMTLDGMPTQFVMVEGVANSAGPGEAAPESLLPAIQVANDLPDTLRTDVRSVLVNTEGVNLQLVAGGVVVLGDTTALRDKLVAVLAVRGTCPPGSYARLDVRAPGRPAVTPRTGCGGGLDKATP